MLRAMSLFPTKIILLTMQEKWRLCTRPVCRLRSDRSRDRQVYTRRRGALGGKSVEGRPLQVDSLFGEAPEGSEAAPLPGRYCDGLCERDLPPERTLPTFERVKLLKK